MLLIQKSRKNCIWSPPEYQLNEVSTATQKKPTNETKKKKPTKTPTNTSVLPLLYHRSITTCAWGAAKNHCYVQTLKIAFYLPAAAFHNEGSVNPPSTRHNMTTPKARVINSLLFSFFQGNCYLSFVPNAISLKCFDCKVLIIFFFLFLFILVYQHRKTDVAKRIMKHNLMFFRFWFQICPAWSLFYFLTFSALPGVLTT